MLNWDSFCSFPIISNLLKLLNNCFHHVCVRQKTLKCGLLPLKNMFTAEWHQLDFIIKASSEAHCIVAFPLF